MERELALPALVLLDEVGTGTDPNEGGALATAIVNHFRQRGALVIATTHYDALKTWGTATDGVITAAFAFDPQTFAPTYRLIYGAPGRSLAIEIAQRLGMPLPVVAAARGFLSDDQKRLAAHLAARRRAGARARVASASRLQRDRRAADEAAAALRSARTGAGRARRAVHAAPEREARRSRAPGAPRHRPGHRSAEGAVRVAHRAGVGARRRGRHLDRRHRRRPRRGARGDRAHRRGAQGRERRGPSGRHAARRGGRPPPTVGARVAVGGLGMEGTIVGIHGQQAEIDVRGKRLRATLKDLRVIGAGRRRDGRGAESSRQRGPAGRARGCCAS